MDEWDRLHDAALAAYRVINPEGPPFSGLSPDIQDRWKRGYGEARAIAPTIVNPVLQVSLNEATFDYARSLLGGVRPEATTIFASSTYGREMRELGAKTGCRYCELPSAALTTRWTWILFSADGMFWSAPTD